MRGFQDQGYRAFDRASADRDRGRLVTIRLDEPTVAYFKGLAAETGIGYQTLINSYLRECAMAGRRPSVRWGRSKGAA